MSIITINDHAQEIPVNRILGEQRYIQGENRECVTIYCDPSVCNHSFDTFLSWFDGVEKIIVREGDNTYIHEDYKIIMKKEIVQDLIESASSTSPAIYQELYTIGLAQLTYREKEIENLKRMVEALQGR